MYRAAALKALRLGVDMSDERRLGEVAAGAVIELTDRGRGPILLDGEDVTEAIRAPEVSEAASVMSTVSAVRRAMVARQRAIGSRESCIMEGRDIGTVVFPDAELKVFLVASIEARARRRYLQRPDADTADPSAEAVIADIMESIAERDRRDTTRTDSPLVRAEDAVEVDTTDMTIDEQVNRVVELATSRGAALPPRQRSARSE